MRFVDAIFARFWLLSRRRSDARFSHEVQFHIDMEAERLQREQGLDGEEAKRRARIAFGGVEKYTEQLRDARGLRWIGGLKLDLLLGIRMMAKWPGLTLVGVIGMAVAVAVGTFAYGLVTVLQGPSIPIDEGHRVVSIENWDARSGNERGETHLHDVLTWRTSIDAVEHVGAYRLVKRNIIVPGARPEPVRIAEMTASGFAIARVAPLMGRHLLEEDERPGAPPVVVIGHDVWMNRFGGATDVVNRTIQIGNSRFTIVGVMPAGFHFPVNDRIWVPLQLEPLRFEAGKAPEIKVFGRLVDGMSIEQAQLQATATSVRLAPSRPKEFADIRTNVIEYGLSFAENPQLAWAMHLITLVVSLLLVVIGINVATLVFARTAGRMGEIAVRTALGASRARIVAQLFAEAFVLSLVSAALGLAGAVYALRFLGASVERLGGDGLPYWFTFDFSAGMVLYVIIMAIVAAFVVGALPALKATSRDVRANLQALGGGGGIRLGRSWTALIIAQVAIAVALLPLVVHVTIVRPLTEKSQLPPYETDGWLTAELQLDQVDVAGDATVNDSAFARRFTMHTGELVRRLRGESGVSDVAVMSATPGHERSIFVQSDAAIHSTGDSSVGPPSGISSAGLIRVETDFFRAFDIPLLIGRPLQAGDDVASNQPVVVNQPFVQRMFDGGNAIGRRIRIPVMNDAGEWDETMAGPWFEIVGVVPDFPGSNRSSTRHPVVYRAMQPEISSPVVIAVRNRGAVEGTLTGRIREVAMTVDPMLRLENVRSLDNARSIEDVLDRLIFTGVTLVIVSVVLLSAAGIYALMSFTIARRRREIGIRAALGAGSRQIVGGVLWRAARQVLTGIILGTLLALVTLQTVQGWKPDVPGLSSLASVVVFMLAVGIAAAWSPARVALKIQPTEALRSE